MAVKRPSVAQLQEVARSLGIHLTDEHAATYNTLLQPSFDAYDLIHSLPDFVPKVTYPRTPGYRPGGEENKYGAWYIKTTIKGAAKGKLAGKTVAIKDNVCVAGVPMMNGSSTMEGYIPNVDATVVTRLLDAGATVAGKAVCEHFCFSGRFAHQRVGAGAQPAPHGLFGRGLVVGQRRARRQRRGRSGDRR